VQTIDQVLSDPQTLARGMVVEQNHPTAGKIKLPNLPFNFSGCDTAPSCPAPLLGQHNAQIAAGLGYSAAQIVQLQSDGVLYAPEAAK
jgi:crotonobetainyl-CoA:carnitine CoA-transferase CaiB-like acyl-CoA transferase